MAKSHSFTFVLEYAGGTYISQHLGRDEVEAFERWLRLEPKKLEKLLRIKLAKRLSKQYLPNEGELVEVHNVQNVWCWSATLPKGLALLNVVKTHPANAPVNTGT